MPLVEKTKPASMQKGKTLVIKIYMEGQRIIIASPNIGVARKLSYLLISQTIGDYSSLDTIYSMIFIYTM